MVWLDGRMDNSEAGQVRSTHALAAKMSLSGRKEQWTVHYMSDGSEAIFTFARTRRARCDMV